MFFDYYWNFFKTNKNYCKMKINNLITLLFVISTSFLIGTGCQNGEMANGSDINENADLETIQEVFFAEEVQKEEFTNLSGNYEKNTLFLHGTFKIVTPGENQLAFYTETEDSKHIFLFNEIENNELVKDLDIQKLYYLKNGILLNNKLFLGIDGNVSELMKKDLSIISKNNSLAEYNNAKVLIHKWFSKNDSNFKEKQAIDLIADTARRGLVHDGDCDAGGEGSTGCSLGGGSSGCSVSCGSGYYACCVLTAIGPNDCHCDRS